MVKMVYAANARIPSEKAHAYQIVQMCEAFAGEGAEVRLLYANRHNPPDLRTDDIWGYYDVEQNFAAGRLPCLDLFPLAARLPHRLRLWGERFVSLAQIATYNAALLARLGRERESIVYSRDPISLWLLAALWPRRAGRAFFEAHTYPSSRMGLRLREGLARRLAGLVVITDQLRQRYAGLKAPFARIIVAHDGIRRARFNIEGGRAYWRERFGWPVNAFIAGYAGRLYGGLESMDKGLDVLVEAVVALADEVDRPVRLALVGGPARRAVELRESLRSRQVPPELILHPGQVPPADVPGYLRAFDVCSMPSPWTEFYAYYTSPMKLFEYMASGTPLVASDLPSTAEVIHDGENGLLVPPDDSRALKEALRRLYDDPALGKRLAERAARDVLDYTWDARARRILGFIRAAIDNKE
jgi:glycosyltransferase involved in cell wall biosynthesis